jgi:hypothetical protein
VASLLWGRWYHECLLLGVGVDLSAVSRFKACSWGSSCDLLLSLNGSVKDRNGEPKRGE